MTCYTTYVNLSTQRSVGELELRDWDAVQLFTQQGLPGVQWEKGPANRRQISGQNPHKGVVLRQSSALWNRKG